MSRDVALLFGVILATAFSALTVVAAFARPSMRFLMARLTAQEPTFPDRLCAGIWTSAVGAVLICAVSLTRLATGHLFPALAAVAWLGIGAGYFLHFTAWRASYTGADGGFATFWAIALLAIVAAGAGALLLAAG